MSKVRPPWWMYAVLVPCTCFCLLAWYSLAFGPQTPGLVTRPHPPGFMVVAVQDGMPAHASGLRVGDVILSVNGQTGRPAVRQFDRVYVGQPFDVVFNRGGERKSAAWTAGRKDRAFWTDPEGVAQVAAVPGTLFTLALAWLCALRRPHDVTARLGSLMFAMSPVPGLLELNPPPGFAAWLGALPTLLAAVPLVAIVLAYTISAPVSLSFLATFPRRRRIARWFQLLIWGPVVFAVFATMAIVAHVVYDAELPQAVMTFLVRPKRLLDLVYTVAFPVVLVWNYHTLTEVGDKRRLRLFVVGALLGAVPGIFDVTLRILTSFGVAPAGRLLLAYWLSPAFVLGTALELASTCLVAYAILRHRVFDLGVIVRQGLQYAAARNLLLALAPMCGALLVLDLTLHSNQTMAQAFVQRGWTYAALAGAALLAHAKRKTWLEALDRRFFRERYDAHRILRTMLTDVRQAGGLEQAAPSVVAQVAMALHPEYAAVLARRPEEPAFRALAFSGTAPPEIPSDGTFMSLVRLLGKPLQVPQSEASWLRQQLPAQETSWLTSTRIEWIFPITLGPDRTEIVLALAPKLSEQPYSREDQELIEGVVSGLALLADRPLTTPGSRPPRLASSPGGASRAQLAHTLPVVQRYTIGRELGRGGMGTVYEARDVELDRDVAIKVMKPELMASPEALARFRREARAAASFSHPNVVTVHDFGVADDGRAYLVMELLAGATLRDVLRNEQRLAPPRASVILHGVCAAIQAAHGRHLLHRDLKPENIFLIRTDAGELPKVLDFGVAKLLEVADDGETLAADTSPGVLLGTLAYMSPEQLRGLPPDASWDLWAIAVIACEMVTGTNPFAGPRRAHMRPAASAVDMARPSAAIAGPWEAFAARALAWDVRDRPSSPGELMRAFDEVWRQGSP